jgi:hypothetical protein
MAIGSQKFPQVATKLRALADTTRNLLPCLQGGSSSSSPHQKTKSRPIGLLFVFSSEHYDAEPRNPKGLLVLRRTAARFLLTLRAKRGS